jgi:hypothetical protein
VTGRGLDTSRISGTYEINNADLGANKLDKGQMLYSMYTIDQHKERWNERIEQMKNRLRDDIMPYVDLPMIDDSSTACFIDVLAFSSSSRSRSCS